MIDFITFCDYTGTFAFAISGIRLASAKQFDWFGAYVVGVVTAVGGGTIRDILLNAVPFWMEQASYLIVSALALLFVIAFRKYVIRLNNTFFIFDAIGLGLFVVVGIAKTLDFGFPMWVAIVMVRSSRQQLPSVRCCFCGSGLNERTARGITIVGICFCTRMRYFATQRSGFEIFVLRTRPFLRQ